jgi:hypothetical protein
LSTPRHGKEGLELSRRPKDVFLFIVAHRDNIGLGARPLMSIMRCGATRFQRHPRR